MALHDPESSAQEKALALKLGRLKKIQIIDGKQVEVVTGDDEDDEYELEDEDEDDEEMMATEVKISQHCAPTFVKETKISMLTCFKVTFC